MAFCFGFWLAVLVVRKKPLPGLGTLLFEHASSVVIRYITSCHSDIQIWLCTHIGGSFLVSKMLSYFMRAPYRPGLWTTTRCMLKRKSAESRQRFLLNYKNSKVKAKTKSRSAKVKESVNIERRKGTSAHRVI